MGDWLQDKCNEIQKAQQEHIQKSFGSEDIEKLTNSNFKKQNLEKASGEGSRGGKVIGHTKSGKPIYDSFEHTGHKDFSKEDHEDAIKTNLKIMKKMFDKRYGKKNSLSQGGILIGKEGSKAEDYRRHEDLAMKHSDAKQNS